VDDRVLFVRGPVYLRGKATSSLRSASCDLDSAAAVGQARSWRGSQKARSVASAVCCAETEVSAHHSTLPQVAVCPRTRRKGLRQTPAEAGERRVLIVLALAEAAALAMRCPVGDSQPRLWVPARAPY